MSAVMTCVALAVLCVAGTAWATTRPAVPHTWASTRPAVPHAWAARLLTVNDEGSLSEVGESGSSVIEQGAIKGTLPGSARVKLNIGPTITATFTLYPRGGGSLSGHGKGVTHFSGRKSSFGGTMEVTSGTGRYQHARGTGGFYGTINRETLAAVVQTRGTLHY